MLLSFISFAAAAYITTASAQTQYTATNSASVAKARATALTESPTSYVKGKTFDRFVTIWCENTDYSAAAGDRNTSQLDHFSIHANMLSELQIPRESRHYTYQLQCHHAPLSTKLCRRSWRRHPWNL